MTVRIITADVRDGLAQLEDESVHCTVCSPPYWGLRAYGTEPQVWGPYSTAVENGGMCEHVWGDEGKSEQRLRDGIGGDTAKVAFAETLHPSTGAFCLHCNAWRGELGLEPTPSLYIEHLVAVFAEARRVLRKDGTLWIVIGDSYTSGNSGQRVRDSSGGFRDGLDTHTQPNTRANGGRKPLAEFKPKDLIGIPWRLAFALQDAGWWLRRDIIWAKPNPMPESVEDRCTSSHEYLFMFAKSERYWYDCNAIKEPAASFGRHHSTSIQPPKVRALQDNGTHGRGGDLSINYERDQRNKRSVWTVATVPSSVPHFACVDEATDCLTERGWLRHDSLMPGILAAQFDLVTSRLSWAPIEGIARYDVSDQMMVHAKTRDLDMLLTPNHRSVVHRRHAKTRLYQDAAIVRADELKSSHAVPTTADWNFLGDSSLPLEWAELLGWYVAEGHESKDSLAVELYQSESANSPHVERIKSLLRQVGAEWTSATYRREWRGRDAEHVAFRIMGYAAARLRELAPRKLLPAGILLWADHQLRALLYGLVAGDGHTRPDGRSSFTQKNKFTADLVQAIAVRLGLSGSLSTRPDGVRVVYITKHKYRSFRGTAGIGAAPTRARYSGVVWCPKTPLGTWVARRNGRVFITGNTYPPALIEPCILAGTSARGVCPKCGAPWGRVIESNSSANARNERIADYDVPGLKKGSAGDRVRRLDGKNYEHVRRATGSWQPTCACDAGDAVPATILDPFIGVGTTAIVADRLGRNCIGIELSPKYATIAERRARSPGFPLEFAEAAE